MLSVTSSVSGEFVAVGESIVNFPRNVPAVSPEASTPTVWRPGPAKVFPPVGSTLSQG